MKKFFCFFTTVVTILCPNWVSHENTEKMDGTDLARYGWVGPTTVKRDGLTWPGMAGWDPPR
jgi:hypothetical protein